MKMTLEKVLDSCNALAGLADLTLPGKLKYAVAYNLEKLQKEGLRLEKQRLELCAQYADKDKDGKALMVESVVNNKPVETYKMSAENQAEFAKEYRELLKTEVDMEIRTVKQDAIDRCEESDRYDIPTVTQIMGMSFMIEDE